MRSPTPLRSDRSCAALVATIRMAHFAAQRLAAQGLGRWRRLGDWYRGNDDRMSIDHEAKRLTFTREPGRIPVRRMSRDALAELYPDPREYKIDRSVPGKWELYQSSGEAYSFDAKLQTLALLRDAGHITDADAIRVITSPLCPRGTAYLVKNTIALTGSEKREGGVIE